MKLELIDLNESKENQRREFLRSSLAGTIGIVTLPILLTTNANANPIRIIRWLLGSRLFIGVAIIGLSMPNLWAKDEIEGEIEFENTEDEPIQGEARIDLIDDSTGKLAYTSTSEYTVSPGKHRFRLSVIQANQRGEHSLIFRTQETNAIAKGTVV
jgi:hypothetical protein